jgi:hypothetical protein
VAGSTSGNSICSTCMLSLLYYNKPMPAPCTTRAPQCWQLPCAALFCLHAATQDAHISDKNSLVGKHTCV